MDPSAISTPGAASSGVIPWVSAKLHCYRYLLQGRQKQFVLLSLSACVATSLDTLGIAAGYPLLHIFSDARADLGPPTLLTPIPLPVVGLALPVQSVCLALVALTLAKSFFSNWYNHRLLAFAGQLDASLRLRVFRSYLEAAPYSFHLRRSSAEQLNTAIGSTDQFSYLIRSLIDGGAALFLALSLASLLIFVNSIATVSLAFILGLGLLLQAFLLRHRLNALSSDNLAANRAILGNIAQALAAFKEIRVLQCEAFFLDREKTASQLRVDTNVKYGIFIRLPRLVIEGLLTLAIIGVVLYASTRPTAGGNIIPAAGVFLMAAIRLVPAFNQLSNMSTMIRMSGANTQALYQALKTADSFAAPEVTQGRPTALHSAPLLFSPAELQHGELMIRDLAFAFQPSLPILRGATASIRCGAITAIMGPSGAGKSTLIDLLLGLLEPTGGHISLGNKNIHANIKGWQRHIAYMPQATFILNDSIERNIAFGTPDQEIDQVRLAAALSATKLRELAATAGASLGENGARISGGQRQRIGIARALYHERDILIFDEPTASLDLAAVREFNDTIQNLRGKKTVLIISHQASAVQGCDAMYFLQNGILKQVVSFEATKNLA